MYTYEILSAQEAQSMFEKKLRQLKNVAQLYVSKWNVKTTNEKDRIETINEVTKALILKEIFNANTDFVLKSVRRYVDDLNELKNHVCHLPFTLDLFHSTWRNTMNKGLRIRQEIQPQYPDCFTQDRIYLKIPEIKSSVNKLASFISEMNWCLPHVLQMDVYQKKEGSFVSYYIKEKYTSKETKAGRFFQTKIRQLDALQCELSSLDSNTLEMFTRSFIQYNFFTRKQSKENGEYFTYNWINDFNRVYHTKIHMDEILYWVIKSNFNEEKRHTLLPVVQNLHDRFYDISGVLHYEQTKQQKGRDVYTKNAIDTIIISKAPRDLTWMSAYTDYALDSCMKPTGFYHKYVINDIGRGTLVAYAVNSQNPYQRLSRVLLKPYKSDTGDIVYHVGKIYGEAFRDFQEIVRDFAEKHLDSRGDSKVFSCDNLLYNDGDVSRIHFLHTPQEWCDYLKLPYTYEDGSLIIRGNFDISGFLLQKLPDFSNVIVDGDFDCSENHLISLKGLPKITGSINCSKNLLLKLDGAPKYVNGTFDCSGNDLETLKGGPEIVKGSYICSKNDLEDLEGAPKRVYGSFDCSYNAYLSTLEGSLKWIGQNLRCHCCALDTLQDMPLVLGSIDCSCNKLKTLSGIQKRVRGSLKCNSNLLTDFTGAPEVVECNFDCSRNKLSNFEGRSMRIGGDFDCSENCFTDIHNPPSYIGGNFNCSFNPLLNIRELPFYLEGNLICKKTQLTADSKADPNIVKYQIEDFSLDVLQKMAMNKSQEDRIQSHVRDVQQMILNQKERLYD